MTATELKILDRTIAIPSRLVPLAVLSVLPVVALAAEPPGLTTLGGGGGAHTHRLQSLAFSPDGSVLATGGGSQPGEIKLWDVESRRLLRTLDGHASTASQTTSAVWPHRPTAH